MGTIFAFPCVSLGSRCGVGPQPGSQCQPGAPGRAPSFCLWVSPGSPLFTSPTLQHHQGGSPWPSHHRCSSHAGRQLCANPQAQGGQRDRKAKTIPPTRGRAQSRRPWARPRGRRAAGRHRRLQPSSSAPRTQGDPHLERGEADGLQGVEAEGDAQRVLEDPSPPGMQHSLILRQGLLRASTGRPHPPRPPGPSHWCPASHQVPWPHPSATVAFTPGAQDGAGGEERTALQLQSQTFLKYLLNDLEKENSHTHTPHLPSQVPHTLSWEIEAWGSEDTVWSPRRQGHFQICKLML